MAIEGQLIDAGLADICQLLAMGRKTGCLTVTDRSNFGYIYFEQGRVIHASVLNRPDRLGTVLVKNGVITDEQLAAAMQEQARHPERRVGQILVEQMEVSQEEIRRYLSVQIEEAVYSLFAWNKGSFRFEPDEHPEEEEALLVSLNAEGLLLEGARRVDEWTQIEKRVPSMDLIFQVDHQPQRDDPDVELTPEQEAVLPLLDGIRTVEEIVLESGKVEFEVAKAIYGLSQAGLVSVRGKRGGEGGDTAPDPSRRLELAASFYRAGMLEEAEAEYEAVLEKNPAHARARIRLGLIALRDDRPAEALGHFDAVQDSEGLKVVLLRNRALALERLGRHDEALDMLREATERAPTDDGVLLASAVALLKAHRYTEAIEAFRTYRERMNQGRDPEPLYFAYALLAAAAAGRSDEATHIGREGLSLYPTSSPILVNLGSVLEHRGEAEAAEALYLRAVQLTAPPPQAHRNLGDIAYARDDATEARSHYERAIKLDPELGAETYRRLGKLTVREGDSERARELWRRALEINPENEAVRMELAALEGREGP